MIMMLVTDHISHRHGKMGVRNEDTVGGVVKGRVTRWNGIMAKKRVD